LLQSDTLRLACIAARRECGFRFLWAVRRARREVDHQAVRDLRAKTEASRTLGKGLHGLWSRRLRVSGTLPDGGGRCHRAICVAVIALLLGGKRSTRTVSRQSVEPMSSAKAPAVGDRRFWSRAPSEKQRGDLHALALDLGLRARSITRTPGRNAVRNCGPGRLRRMATRKGHVVGMPGALDWLC